ncbi:4-oxalocrotonate tautomerase DmpI [Bacteroides fragilis]
MPYITIEGGGHSPVNKKSELIRKVTEVASEVMQIPMEFFLCTVKELPDENIGIGGRTIDLIK